MARWNDEMLDRLADQTQANTAAISQLHVQTQANAEAITRLEAKVEANAEAITRLEAQVSELREGQAMMMQIIMQQQSSIEELRQDTRTMQADVRLLLDVLTRNYPNGHQGGN
jgi:FtsZ-binding cell division protein ZapB